MRPSTSRIREYRALQEGCPRGLSKAVLDAIVRHRSQHGFSPSVRELVADTGLATQTVVGRLRELERTGYIQRTNRTARSIVLLDKGQRHEPAR
jgi:SOS-response transcriptional repressor LexA